MSIDRLKQDLSFLTNSSDLNAVVYFVTKNANDYSVNKADIESSAQSDLLNEFKKKFVSEIISNPSISLMNLSQTDDRKDVIYSYDLENEPEELNVIDRALTNEDLETFRLSATNLSDIYALIVVIGDTDHQIALYIKNYSVNVIKQSSCAFLKSTSNRLERIPSDILNISRNFCFFKFNDTLYIKDVKTLERFFGFHEAIKTHAEHSIGQISQKGLLDNTEFLTDYLDDITFSRKLAKISQSSPVLNKSISNTDILDFTKTYTALKDIFSYSENGEKIILKTKKQRDYFVKLLNDDFLISQLTKNIYDSIAKNDVTK